MDIKLNELFIDGEAPMAATDAAVLTPSPKSPSFRDSIPQPPKMTFVGSGSSLLSSSSLLSDDSSRSKPQVEDDPPAAESDESDREFPTPKIAEPEAFPVRMAIIIAITNCKQL